MDNFVKQKIYSWNCLHINLQCMEVTEETYQTHQIVTFLSDILRQANKVCQVLVGRHFILHGFFNLLFEGVNFFLRSPKEFPK